MSNDDFLRSLESGELRVASFDENTNCWIVDITVKERILNVFKTSDIVAMAGGFRDKAPLCPRSFSDDMSIRMVPGGSAVRAGAYIGKNVVIMPPSYVNIGAYIDDSTMVDSHVLVGSCAQIGRRVHLSTAVQIGGVLEPVGNLPVIVEDDCFLGAGSVVVEGVIVRKGAVLAPHVVLTASVPIYDVINKNVFYGEVPENAVVISGSRPISDKWAHSQGLHLSCPVIIKYRDAKTNAALSLEDALRASSKFDVA